MIKNISIKELKELNAIKTPGLLTVYMPLAKGLQGHKQNVSQLHNFRSELKKLVDFDQHALFTQLLETVSNDLVLENSHDGLALYSNGTVLVSYFLPYVPEPYLQISNTYMLQPVYTYLEDVKNYYVLAISKNGSHLYKGDAESMKMVPVVGLGKDVETTLRIDEKQSHVIQNHPVAAGGGKNSEGFHGHGGFKDMKEILFDEYLRVVDKLVMKTIANDKLPLVLVAVGYAQSAYKHISKYPSIYAAAVSTNPDALSAAELHNKTLQLLA